MIIFGIASAAAQSANDQYYLPSEQQSTVARRYRVRLYRSASIYPMPTARPQNPDQAALHRYLASRDASISFDQNPMAMAMKMRIVSIDTGIGTIDMSFEPPELFVQGVGVLQGGAVSAMLDFVMAFAVLAVLPLGQSCATANLTVAFLRAAPKGRYRARGEIERRGRQLAFTRARLTRDGEPDSPIATATSTVVILA